MLRATPRSASPPLVGVRALDVLEPLPSPAGARATDRVGGHLAAPDERSSAGVTDHVEAGLQTGLGAGDDVRGVVAAPGTRGRGGPAARGRCRRTARGRPRCASRSSRRRTGRPPGRPAGRRRAPSPDTRRGRARRRGGLAPVRHDPYPDSVGHASSTGRSRAPPMNGPDISCTSPADLGGAPQGRLVGVGALGVGHVGAAARARGARRARPGPVPSQPARSAQPARAASGLVTRRSARRRGTGNLGAARGPVELGARRRPALGQQRLVPAVPEHGAPGVRGHVGARRVSDVVDPAGAGESTPVMSSPVSKECTCPSTKAGVTRAPARSTTSSALPSWPWWRRARHRRPRPRPAVHEQGLGVGVGRG